MKRFNEQVKRNLARLLRIILEAIRQLMALPEPTKKRRIGFEQN